LGPAVIRQHLSEARRRGLIDPPPEISRIDRHDAEFWKKKYDVQSKELAAVEKLCEELAGISGNKVVIPEWLRPKSKGRKAKAVVNLLISDVHAGEVVPCDDLAGINAFDLDICRTRLRRYFAASCDVGLRWTSDTQCIGAVVSLAGDLISGDIHEELRKTNCLTSVEQVVFAAEEIAAGLLHVADTFGRVHVVSVAGNHGRVTAKPEYKLYARSSYDTLIAEMIARELAKDKRFTFQIPPSMDAIVPVLGFQMFVTHGNNMGTGGGAGFAGPVLPIIRGVKKIELQQFHVQRHFDIIQHGHYHTTANVGNALSNGSVPGYTEYPNGIRAAPEAPAQWLSVIHENWGLRERSPIKLEKPRLAALPRSECPF
jgi:hypothetical protein